MNTTHEPDVNLPMRITLLTPDQHDSCIDLHGELHAHYHGGALPARDVVRTHLHEHLLGADSPLHLGVACDADGRVLGLAAILFVHSLVEPAPPHDRQCHVKELFVRAAARGRGVGRALMAWAAREALRHGCGRVDWHVQAANQAGMRFYTRLGAHPVEDRLSFRLGREAMHALAREGAEFHALAREGAAFQALTRDESAFHALAREGAGFQALAPEGADQAGPAARPAAAPPADGALPDDMALRPAVAADALCLSVLAMQVFLDTYATSGIRPAIAREVLSGCSLASFEFALLDPATRLWVAERAGHLVGFAQVTLGAAHPLAPAGEPAELQRLYVQEWFTGRGVGRALLEQAERGAAQAGATVLWLTHWVHNQRALRFYARRGYQDHGLTWFVFEAESHANRVCAKSIQGA